MLDFSIPGELGVFIDDKQVENLERRMNQRGYLEGSEMAGTFNMLRSNDLIWSFVINNYLMGKDPFPFDLLYWNSDSTRMPANMHSFYLRNMYMANKLKDPGGRRWYVNGQGQTMVVIPGPVEFRMGSPLCEPDRKVNEKPHRRVIQRSYAIMTKPVAVTQWTNQPLAIGWRSAAAAASPTSTARPRTTKSSGSRWKGWSA
jgi:hypothetical protein